MPHSLLALIKELLEFYNRSNIQEFKRSGILAFNNYKNMQDKSLKVLIIEDEQVFRSLALQVFEGYEKITAITAKEGFERFKEYCPDITLLDIGLPGGNGLDLLKEIIAYDPEAFVVMLTMSRVASDVKLARERGAAGYIIKPFSYQKVAQCILKYQEYKKKLQNMTPEERAGKIIASLKIEALHDDLNNQVEEQEKPKTPEQNEELILRSWKILFADDFLTNREKAKVQLAKLGCHVEIVENGASILEKYNKVFFNIIFIDSEMSDLSGYEVAQEIRKMEQSKKSDNKAIIIAMVENSTDLDRHLWQKAGMNDFILKPASFLKLKEMVHKHVKRYLDSFNEEYIP